jgi:hypothetical protein
MHVTGATTLCLLGLVAIYVYFGMLAFWIAVLIVVLLCLRMEGRRPIYFGDGEPLRLGGGTPTLPPPGKQALPSPSTPRLPPPGMRAIRDNRSHTRR